MLKIKNEIKLDRKIMGNKNSKKESYHSKMLFDAIMIYLGCWYEKERKMSDFYGKKGAAAPVVFGKINFFNATRSRIRLLEKADVPINVRRVDKYSIKGGSMVILEKEKVLLDFLMESRIGGLTEAQKILFLNVIQLASQHLEFQLEYFYREKEFLDEEIGQKIKQLVSIFENSPQALKFFPILLSFDRKIDVGKRVKKRKIDGRDFQEFIKMSQSLFVTAHLTSYFLRQIEGVNCLVKMLLLPDIKMTFSVTEDGSPHIKVSDDGLDSKETPLPTKD